MAKPNKHGLQKKTKTTTKPMTETNSGTIETLADGNTHAEAACFIQDGRNIVNFRLYKFRTRVKNLRVISSKRIEIKYLSLRTGEEKMPDKGN